MDYTHKIEVDSKTHEQVAEGGLIASRAVDTIDMTISISSNIAKLKLNDRTSNGVDVVYSTAKEIKRDNSINSIIDQPVNNTGSTIGSLEVEIKHKDDIERIYRLIQDNNYQKIFDDYWHHPIFNESTLSITKRVNSSIRGDNFKF